MIRGAFLTILLAASSVQAGDYLLFIADSDTCTSSASNPTTFPSAAVVADLDRHFSGTAPQIGIFRAAFSNARVMFCGDSERAVVEDTLVSWAVRGPSSNESDLFDYFLMLGTQRLAEQIRTVSESKQSREATARLKRAELAVSRGRSLRSS